MRAKAIHLDLLSWRRRPPPSLCEVFICISPISAERWRTRGREREVDESSPVSCISALVHGGLGTPRQTSSSTAVAKKLDSSPRELVLAVSLRTHTERRDGDIILLPLNVICGSVLRNKYKLQARGSNTSCGAAEPLQCPGERRVGGTTRTKPAQLNMKSTRADKLSSEETMNKITAIKYGWMNYVYYSVLYCVYSTL